MIRATTGGVLKSYRRNLMSSFISQNNARNTVLTQRNFNSYAEDPASAAKAFRLRKSRMTVESQYSICSDAAKKYETAFSCLQSIDEVLDTKGSISGEFMNTLHGATLTWLNDPTGDAREQLTKAIDKMSESLVQTMNQKYGDNFIFAGADGHNVPFEVKQENGKNQLLYRGVPVDAAVPELMKDNSGNPIAATDADGKACYVLASATTVEKLPDLQDDPVSPGNLLTLTTVGGNEPVYVRDGATSYQETHADVLADPTSFTKVDDGTGNIVCYRTADIVSKDDYDKTLDSVLKDGNDDPITVTIDGKDCYVLNDDTSLITETAYEAEKLDAEKLKYLAEEKYFVDIGLGFKEDEKGKLIESSGFNAALNGINFLGYGVDADGDPKNLYSLVQKMKEVSESAYENDNWKDVYDEFHGLVGKFEKACSTFKTEFIGMSASTTKLQNQEKLLQDNFYNLQEQCADLEDVDMVESIESFLWAEYAYNAALKVGNNILSQSLMDYLS